MSTGEATGIVKDQALGLVTRVRYMLEYMTLCGDPTLFLSPSKPQPYPVPSGIPMGLVCLPDFVVDVAVDGIKSATATRRGQLQPLDVGGRAGRLAWALHNFGGQQNGWYNLKYVAKAGDVGRVVLRRRFIQPSGQTPFEPTSLRYIVPSREDRNWLHVYGEELVEPVESSHEGLEVSVADVDESPYYSLTDLFVDARYVVISSKHSTHALSALDLVAEGLERLSRRFGDSKDTSIPIGILVDLSALASQDDARRVVDSFGQLKGRALAFAIESTALCNRQTDFDKTQFDHILVREAQGVRFGDQFELIPEIASRPVAREAFTAGYVLAASCDLGWKLLRRWHKYCSKMRPIDGRPHASFPSEEVEPGVNGSSPYCTLLPSLACGAPDAFSPAERFAFAATLARHTESTPLSYRELLRAMAKVGVPSFNDIERGEIEVAIASKDDLATKLGVLEANTALIGRLVPRFEDESAATTRSLCLPPSELGALVSSCQLRDARQENQASEKSIDKAVMFDLDATLVDSGGMLRACWFNGLRAFFREAGVHVESGGIHTVIDVYETYVYKNHARFSKVLRDHPDIPPEWQPCDFRQIWNHRYAWATLLWILDVKPDPLQNGCWDDERWRSILTTHREHISAEHSSVGCECDVCQQLEKLLAEDEADLSERRERTLPLRDQLIRFKSPIQAARNAFWEVDYPCYPQTRSCVKMIRAVPGCEVYVVTEGHEETQLQKLKCAGLADLFPRSRVLSTGAASAAEQSSNDLTKLLHSHKRTRVQIQRASEDVGKEAKKSLEPVLGTLDATIGSISFLKDLLSVLYSKRHTRFYSAVIDAIRRKPESPAQLLLSFVGRRDLSLRQELGGGTPMKFFMIGDRYDNDCKPLLELNLSNGDKVGVGTCRLLSGKRSREHCPPKLTPPRPTLSTMLVCDTLAQIAHILHYTTTWEQIALLEEVTPPVLLDSKEGEIHYGPIGPEADVMVGGLEPLAPRFKDMSWARADKILRDERSVQDMLNQIEKDLAVCDVVSLSQFFKSVGKDIDEWWQEADAGGGSGPASTLLKGALKILANVNWWRHMLGRPLLEAVGAPSGTLEWVLGSHLLRISGRPLLRTSRGDLRWAHTRRPLGIQVDEVLEALPFSREGIAIATALGQSNDATVGFHQITDWLDKANRLKNGK